MNAVCHCQSKRNIAVNRIAHDSAEELSKSFSCTLQESDEMQFVSVKNIFGFRFVLSPQSISRWQKSAWTCSSRHCSALKTPAASFTQTTADKNVRTTKLANGPSLSEFLMAGTKSPLNRSGTDADVVPYLDMHDVSGRGRKVFFEVYGCQMNVNDTEIVWSILKSNDYVKVEDVNDADVVLLVTCAIREKAESKVTHGSKLIAAEQRNNSFILSHCRFGIG